MRNRVPLAVLLYLLSFSGESPAFTVVFQPAALPGGASIVSQWREQGLQFVTPQGVVSNDISDSMSPFNGTSYLQLLGGQTPLTITTINLAPFSLGTIDLAEYSTVFTGPMTVTFTGTKASGGSAVTATFVTDGIIDGNGPSPDFQTFVFPASFSGLSQVTVNMQGFSFDNLTATVIPEPSSVIFLLFGCLLLSFALKLRLGTRWR